jgi:hypothetical protein
MGFHKKEHLLKVFDTPWRRMPRPETNPFSTSQSDV